MNALEKLAAAQTLISEAMVLIEGEYVPPPPPPNPDWPVALHSLADEAGYLQNPGLIKNGSEILCFYRKGTSHLASGLGKIMLKRSNDLGQTWSSEEVFYEITNKDCRGIIAGRNPDTGLLIVTFHSANTGGTIEKDWIATSMGGVSWNVREFTEVYALGNHHGFGAIVKTSNGLMLTYYWFNRVYGLFSTDGGLTWGSPVTIYTGGGSSTLVEPWVHAIDNDRIVCVSRDNADGGRYWSQKSSNGGLTWSAPVSARWTYNTSVGAAPCCFIAHGSNVYFGWDGREPFGKQYLTIVDKEAFWTDPRIGWQTGAATQVIYTSKILLGSATSSDYGYITMLDLSEGVLRVFYDSKTGNGSTETEILVGSI